MIATHRERRAFFNDVVLDYFKNIVFWFFNFSARFQNAVFISRRFILKTKRNKVKQH